MTEYKEILSQLNAQSMRISEQSKQLGKIEAILVQNAEQNVKIIDIQKQIDQLWAFHNKNFGANGTVSHILSFQASCPREQFGLLKWAIGACLTLSVGTFGIVVTHFIKAALP